MDPVITPAPIEPPSALLASYTLDGAIPLETFYIDEASSSASSSEPFVYDLAELDGCVAHAGRLLAGTARQAVTRGGGVDRQLIARALGPAGDAPVEGAAVVVFGATDPWVECLCLAAGAKSVTTVEYQHLVYEHPNMHNILLGDFERALGSTANAASGSATRLAGSFDVAIALSAFDHDGLGRYGDRLHPNGDLLAMRTAWRALRPSGRLLLSAPVGPDLLVWNLHRRYGPLRLPRLLAGWQEDARLGFDPARLTATSDHRRRYEPLFVLRRNGTDDLAVQGEGVVSEGGEACEAEAE